MGEILMSENEAELSSLLDRHLEGALKLKEVAQRAGLSCRQAIRKKKAYLKHGKAGLVSKKRGNTSNRAYPSELKTKVISILKEERYDDFGPTLASETLAEDHNIQVNKETLRQWMIQERIWKGKKARTVRVFQQRERREKFGELIQLDGSPHDWFERRGPKCTLLMAIDDATSRITSAQFEEQETTFGYFRLMKAHLEQYGRPLELYPDKYGVFKVNIKGSKNKITQFTRGMNQLKISVTCANSPQAKGRIERSFRTHQDRLVKAMRLAGISSIDEANRFLVNYIPKHNKRFGKTPRDPVDAHEPLNPIHDLRRILAKRKTRKISKNLEISWNNEALQIQAPNQARRLAGNRCNVIETLDGEILLEYEGKLLKWKKLRDLPADPAPVADSKQLVAKWKTGRGKGSKPSWRHPWRCEARAIALRARRKREK